MMNPELVVALSALLTAILAGIGGIVANRNKAQRNELESLQNEVARLERKVDALSRENEERMRSYRELYTKVLLLERENAWLLSVLADHDIAVPPMPERFGVRPSP